MAAADCVWTGAVSDAASGEAGNWTGGVPLNGETVTIPKTATNNLASAMAGLPDTILSWVVEPGSTVSVGASGSPLQVAITNVNFFGAAAFWYNADAGTTADTLVLAANKDVIINLDGATFTNLHLLRGNVTLGSAIGNIANIQVGYVSDRANDVSLTINSNANTITRLVQNGGVINSQMAITTLEVKAGICNLNGTQAVASLDQTGGIVRYNTTGTLTAGHIHRGAEFDANQSTLATTITTLWRYPGSIVKARANAKLGANCTITNDFDLGDLT